LTSVGCWGTEIEWHLSVAAAGLRSLDSRKLGQPIAQTQLYNL